MCHSGRAMQWTCIERTETACIPNNGRRPAVKAPTGMPAGETGDAGITCCGVVFWTRVLGSVNYFVYIIGVTKLTDPSTWRFGPDASGIRATSLSFVSIILPLFHYSIKRTEMLIKNQFNFISHVDAMNHDLGISSVCLENLGNWSWIVSQQHMLIIIINFIHDTLGT